MTESRSTDLVTIATIFSRPELICFVAALEDWGIATCIVGNHWGNLTQEIVAMGGYSIRVAELDVEIAVELIAELRQGSEPIGPLQSLKRRIWILFAFLTAMGSLQTYVSVRASGDKPNWPTMLVGFLSAASYPFPMRMAGDYLDRRRRMVQMR